MCQIVGQVLWGFTYKQGISAPGAFIMDTAEASLDSPVHSLCCHPACTEMMLRHGPCAHQGHSPGFRSVQFRCSVVSDSLWPHGLQHCQASLSVTNSRSLLKLMSIELVMPSNHLILCRSLSSCPQSFPASGSFQVSQLFAQGSQSIEVSASTSVLPMNIQDWFPLRWTGWISLQSKGFSRVFSNTTVQKHQFFSAQLSL